LSFVLTVRTRATAPFEPMIGCKQVQVVASQTTPRNGRLNQDDLLSPSVRRVTAAEDRWSQRTRGGHAKLAREHIARGRHHFRRPSRHREDAPRPRRCRRVWRAYRDRERSCPPVQVGRRN
jgi:hypothetical protein